MADTSAKKYSPEKNTGNLKSERQTQVHLLGRLVNCLLFQLVAKNSVHITLLGRPAAIA